MKVGRVVFAAVVLGVLGWAQTASTSQINGTVQDASGAAVPGADIMITQTDTGATRTVSSGTDGSYIIPSLPVGPYSLEVTKPGFAKYEQRGIVLQVASNPTIPVTLKVGDISEHVEVEANASLVETQSTGVGSVIDSQRVVDLPLVGRQVSDLILLSGGAVNAGTTGTAATGPVYPNTTSYNIAGGLPGGNTYTLDGSFHNDVYANASFPLPFPDALQEFKVETSSVPAQYGYHSGAAISAVTKSGTNEWHGSLFEFLRNYDVNARNFFATTTDGLKRNQWGGTVGAPIKKNKLFFFAGFQGTETRQTPSDTIAFVPTAQMLTGDFSTFASSTCQAKPLTLKNPTTGQALTGNKMPSALISPVAVSISKLLPAPTNACGQTNFGIPVSSAESFGVGRVDYQLTPTHSMFVRYLGTEFDQAVPYSLTKNPLATTTAGVNDLAQSLTVGDTYLFGATVVNSFRGTFDRIAMRRIASQFFGPEDVGINTYTYLPHFLSLAVTSGFSVGGAPPGTAATFRIGLVQLGDDVMVSRGDHQLAFGVNAMRYQYNGNATSFAPGLFSSTGGATGSGLADFVTGQVASFQQGAPNHTYPRESYFGLYAQDTWKVRPGLTLSYGLRWEPWFPPQVDQNINLHFDMNGFLQGTTSKVFVNAPPGLFFPGDPLFGPNGTASMNKVWKQFAPRVGIVWDPTRSGKMVIRAAYGIFYDQAAAQLWGSTGQGPPWGGKISLVSPPGGLANPFLGQPGGNPFPFVLSPNTVFPQYGTMDSYNANTRVPYVNQWNLGIQRQFGKDWLVSVSYVGNEAVHIYGERDLNPAIYEPGTCAKGQYGLTAPGPCSTTANTNARRLLTLLNPTQGTAYGFVGVWDDGGTRSYNGLLLNTQKRLSHGFTITANYTWSHCIGEPINNFPNGDTGLYFAPTRAGDRGDCVATGGAGGDHRHIANMTGLASMPKFQNKALRIIASDWKGSATASMYSGDAITIVTGVDNALNALNTTTQYANQLLPNVYGNGTISQWLNPSAFTAPSSGTFGNMNPGTVRGPGALIVNAGVSRLFRIRERHVLEFRTEAQNVLNHTNLGDPTVTLNSSTFGRIISTAAGSAGNARIMQFALKYVF